MSQKDYIKHQHEMNLARKEFAAKFQFDSKSFASKKDKVSSETIIWNLFLITKGLKKWFTVVTQWRYHRVTNHARIYLAINEKFEIVWQKINVQ